MSTSLKYERYLSMVANRPWAILPEKARVIRDLIAFRAAGHRFTAEEIAERLALAPARDASGGTARGIAVIPVHGVVAYRADSFEASSGGASAEAISYQLRKAMQDPEVGTIVLDVDSPGGTVDGVPELAAEIAAAAKVKHVVAHANALAASAAYWLASQATEFVITPSGQVGSIGVYLLTEDWSEHLAQEGVKINPITYGENKLEGNWWEPLSDEARAHLQGQVDAIGEAFVKAVAKGRGVSVSAVKKTFGQGRVFAASEALALGMVDAIEPFQTTLARLQRGGARKGRGMAAGLLPEPDGEVFEVSGIGAALGAITPGTVLTCVDVPQAAPVMVVEAPESGPLAVVEVPAAREREALRLTLDVIDRE